MMGVSAKPGPASLVSAEPMIVMTSLTPELSGPGVPKTKPAVFALTGLAAELPVTTLGEPNAKRSIRFSAAARKQDAGLAFSLCIAPPVAQRAGGPAAPYFKLSRNPTVARIALAR